MGKFLGNLCVLLVVAPYVVFASDPVLLRKSTQSSNDLIRLNDNLNKINDLVRFPIDDIDVDGLIADAQKLRGGDTPIIPKVPTEEKQIEERARKLSEEFKVARAAGDTQKQSKVMEQIDFVLKETPSALKYFLLFEVFIAAKGKIMTAGIAATGKAAVPIAGAISVAYLSSQLIQLGQFYEFKGGGLYSKMENLKERARFYEFELNALMECRDSVSAAKPCRGHTTQAEVDNDIAETSQKINEFFNEARVRLYQVAPANSANDDYYKPKDGFFKFNYVNPLRKTWDFINPF